MSNSFADEAKQELLNRSAHANSLTSDQILGGSFFELVTLCNLSIAHCADGRILCSFFIPPHLTDEEGNWCPGAIATVIDVVGAAAIQSVVGLIKVSVDFSISFFSAVKINEEVEIETRMVEHKGDGKLTAVQVEVRKKANTSLVALGQQWMASVVVNHRSHL